MKELSQDRAFIKLYKADNENSLQLHTDNSYLTLSLCLIGEAEGAEVQFKNNMVKLNGVKSEYFSDEFYSVKPRTGWIYVHFGRHPH